MMMYGLLVLPLVVALDRTVERDNYILTFDDKTLKSINVNGQASDILDLSNLDIESVNEDVFANLTNLKTLNLSNNTIRSFREFTCASLTNLKILNLANNPLMKISFSHGFGKLETLDVRNTNLCFMPGEFYGLAKNTNILTHGSPYGVIYAATFENPTNLTTRKKNRPNKKHISNVNVIPLEKSVKKPKVKVCVENGKLKSLEIFNENETLSEDCREVDRWYQSLELTNLGIATIAGKWYRLQEHHEPTLSFYRNEIVRVTKELLNDIPNEITILNLMMNKIERLERGIIENSNPIEQFDLRYNLMNEIEDGALEKLNITGTLFLDGNKLNNTKFLDSLSPNIADVRLTDNEITEISAGNFSRFTSFKTLDLSKNNITEVKANRLRDFSSLEKLDLSQNGLEKIEPGFFQNLKNLKVVNLRNNEISNLEDGVFAGLESISDINLANNKLTEIKSYFFSNLPNSLEALNLRYNLVENLKIGTFVNVPTLELDLDGNKIWKIEKGSFNLPKLEILSLTKNLLTEMDGDSFQGLPNLDRLVLSDNLITTIKKRAAKNLNSLTELNLSRNPIKRLEDGALFGLSKTTDTRIIMYQVMLEVIKAGVFHDV